MIDNVAVKPCVAKMVIGPLFTLLGFCFLFGIIYFGVYFTVSAGYDLSRFGQICIGGALIIGGLFAIGEILNLLFMSYILQEDQIVVKTGIIWKKNRSMPYHKLTDAELSQGPIERIFGFANLSLQTAGSGEVEAVLYGLGNFTSIQMRIREKIRNSKNNAPIGDDTNSILREMLETLKLINSKIK